jgi:hypothetical protein
MLPNALGFGSGGLGFVGFVGRQFTSQASALIIPIGGITAFTLAVGVLPLGKGGVFRFTIATLFSLLLIDLSTNASALVQA